MPLSARGALRALAFRVLGLRFRVHGFRGLWVYGFMGLGFMGLSLRFEVLGLSFRFRFEFIA